MVKFVIAAPQYTDKSGGVMVLHKLCDSLNRIGFEAYIVFFSGGPEDWQWGVANFSELYGPGLLHAEFPQGNPDEVLKEIFSTAIMIYPDLIQGNPLGAERVVKYLLYKNHGYDGALEGEYVMAFSKAYHDSPNFCLYNPFVDSRLNAVGAVHWSKRSLDCTYIGKGFKYADSYRIPGTLEITRGWPSDKEQLGELLRQCRYFFTWDAASATNLDAVACGAVPVVLQNQQCSFDEIAKFETGALPVTFLRDFGNKNSVELDCVEVDAAMERIVERMQYYDATWDERVYEFAISVASFFVLR